MSKQIFSKIAKIGEEVRTAQLIKVELASAFTPYLKEASMLMKQAETMISDVDKRSTQLYAAAKALVEMEKTASALFQKVETLKKANEKSFINAVEMTKELGIDVSAIPDLKEATAAIDMMSRSASSAESDLGFIVGKAKLVL
jgi:hypothetical protein